MNKIFKKILEKQPSFEELEITNTMTYLEKKKILLQNFMMMLSTIQKRKKTNKIMLLSIGTNLVLFDQYGPKVGDLLKNSLLPNNITCYGNMLTPIHALNLKSFIHEHKNDLKQSLVITIDAGIAYKEKLGSIHMFPYGIKPGEGVDKRLPCIGDCGIIGFTKKEDTNWNNNLPTDIPLAQINEMSQITFEVISEGITLALKKDI